MAKAPKPKVKYDPMPECIGKHLMFLVPPKPKKK